MDEDELELCFSEVGIEESPEGNTYMRPVYRGTTYHLKINLD